MQEIASKAALMCEIDEDLNIAYHPVWPFETASTESSNGIAIYLEQPLFLNPSCNRDVLVKRNLYLHGHELMHPEESKFSLGEWFRYDVLSRPYHLDFSPEGFEHTCEMSEKDTIIDSKLILRNPNFFEGFAETHIISALDDSRRICGRRIGKRSGKIRLFRNISIEDILSLQLGLGRRYAIVTLAKNENLIPDPAYQDYIKFMKKQHEKFRVLLRYPEFQDISEAIKLHFIRTSLKQKDRSETLLRLMQRFKQHLENHQTVRRSSY